MFQKSIQKIQVGDFEMSPLSSKSSSSSSKVTFSLPSPKELSEFEKLTLEIEKRVSEC